jgi:hypothetical protein
LVEDSIIPVAGRRVGIGALIPIQQRHHPRERLRID